MPRYTHDELIEAHRFWARLSPDDELARLIAWELYVDIRDGLDVGTTTIARIQKENSHGDDRAVYLDLDG